MNKRLTGMVLSLLLGLPALAAERITEEQIRTVIAATDAAAMQRDATGIGAYLSDAFEKIIEFQYKKWMAKVRLDKDDYLDLIAVGWTGIEAYDYQRTDTEIHILPDGLSGESYSTVTEHMVRDGVKMTSRTREYTSYALENDRPVITGVSGYTLVGDTTPY